MNSFEWSRHESSKIEQDPRQDLLERLPSGVVSNLKGYQRNYTEARKGFAAQMMDVEITTADSKEGSEENRIIVRPQSLENALFLPQDKRRLEWEEVGNKGADPFYEKNHETNIELQKIYEKGALIEKPISLSGIRIAMGTIYEYLDPEDQKLKMIIRVNNDPNNMYAGWGNTNSGLITLEKPGSNPSIIQRRTLEEIIPATRDVETGRAIPFYPQKGFFRDGNWSDYKKKAGRIQQLDPLQEHIPTKRAEFSSPPYLKGVNMQFDYSNLGNSAFCGMKDVSASLTDAGTLELQSIVHLSEKPDFLLDPEFGSDILVVAVEDLAKWEYERKRMGVARLDSVSVIDGFTGLPTEDQEKNIHYRDNFKASPPLENITRDLRYYYEKNQ